MNSSAVWNSGSPPAAAGRRLGPFPRTVFFCRVDVAIVQFLRFRRRRRPPTGIAWMTKIVSSGSTTYATSTNRPPVPRPMTYHWSPPVRRGLRPAGEPDDVLGFLPRDPVLGHLIP